MKEKDLKIFNGNYENSELIDNIKEIFLICL